MAREKDRTIPDPREPVLKVPDPHGSIVAGRREMPAIRAERQAADPAVVPSKREDFLL